MPKLDLRRSGPPLQHQDSRGEREREPGADGPRGAEPLARDAQTILALQRSLGNRAVGRLLAQRRAGRRSSAC